MQSQPLKLEPLQSKDVPKRKKANRTAKMKQIKLDARREQWLSQVRPSERFTQVQHVESISGQDIKRTTAITLDQVESANGLGLQTFAVNNIQMVDKFVEERLVVEESFVENQAESWKGCSGEFVGSERSFCHSSRKCFPINASSAAGNYSSVKGKIQRKIEKSSESIKNLPFGNGNCASRQSDMDSNNYQNPFGLTVKVAKSVVKHGDVFSDRYEKHEQNILSSIQNTDTLHEWRTDVSPSLSSCSTTRSSSCTESFSEDDSNAPQEDDWEAVADAFHKKLSATYENCTGKRNVNNLKEVSLSEKMPMKIPTDVSLAKELQLKPEYKYKVNPFSPCMKSSGERAWRSNDVSNSPTMVKTAKSVPYKSMVSVWAPLPRRKARSSPAPSECPICTEELDSTDCSFSPCGCGFRLCLFCHHKIVLEDGRCPGCRKTYSINVSLKKSSF